MIQPLRTLHKRMFYVIAIVTPTIFFVALTQRDTQFVERACNCDTEG